MRRYHSGTPLAVSRISESEYLAKARRKPVPIGFDVAGEREADVARQRQGRGRHAMLQNPAAARARLLDIRILGKVPVRIVDLQEMMKDIADEDGATAL